MADQEEYPGAEDEPSSEQAKAEPSSPADSPGFSLNVLEKSQPNVKHENPRSVRNNPRSSKLRKMCHSNSVETNNTTPQQACSNVISQRNEEQLQQRGQQQQPLASASIVTARTQEVEDCSSVESTSFRIGTKKCSRPEPRRNHLPPPPASPLSLSPPAADEHTTADDVITINVSGNRFQTYMSTLRRFPNSLLGNTEKRHGLWNKQLQEYFIDRSSVCFEAILNIYQTGGQVVRPVTMPIELFIVELAYYELKDDVWANFCESEGCRVRPPPLMPKNEIQRKLWNLMEHPDTSLLARFVATLSVIVIIISIVTFCMETIPELKPDGGTHREWSSPFFWIEFFCCLWFSIELGVRFLASPSKSRFVKSFLNILDFVAVAPFFINLIWQQFDVTTTEGSSSTSFAFLRIVRLVRVFRIFKLSRHSTGLQVLGKTFQASMREFFLLIFFMMIALVLGGSGIYFAEQGEEESKFTSIPASFWFVLVTMTTVGYGDMVPIGTFGKIVGSGCALIGVLTLALPIPIIVANFKKFYRQEIILAKMYEEKPSEFDEPISVIFNKDENHGSPYEI